MISTMSCTRASSSSSPIAIARRSLCSTCLSLVTTTQRPSLPSGGSSICRRRQYSAQTPRPPPLKLAIIGAGPSGFYTASRVLASLPPDSPNGADVEVHMYERLPTPYGLVRYGVAPDHPEVKNCQHKFDELSKDPRFRYFGNVLITTQPSIPRTTSTSSSSSSPAPSKADQPLTALSSYTYPHALRLPLSSLIPHYNSLLLSYGASLSNPLSSVPGSSSSLSPLANVHPALALVGWYNGHPAFTDLPIDLRGIEEVVVVGQGNVALDVARILLKPVSSLRETDLPERVLDVLAKSDVRKVTAVGRRGPGQVAFTTKEFREMSAIPDVGIGAVDQGLMDEAKGMVEGDRMRTRLLGLIQKVGIKGDSGHGKEFKLDFLKSPKAFIPRQESGSDTGSGYGTVGQVEWTHNELLIPPPSTDSSASGRDGSSRSLPSSRAGIVARPTGETSTMRADMIIESVGYRSEPLGPESGGSSALNDNHEYWNLPFDEKKGRVSNIGGRVVDADGIAVPGVYAAGWVSRGPIGVIASTMQDAYTVADQLMADHYQRSSSATTGTHGGAGGSSPLSVSGTPESRAPDLIERGLNDGSVVDLERWERIDAAERERGKVLGKEREKFVRVEEMLEVL